MIGYIMTDFFYISWNNLYPLYIPKVIYDIHTLHINITHIKNRHLIIRQFRI